jgi:hypothetical protein
MSALFFWQAQKQKMKEGSACALPQSGVQLLNAGTVVAAGVGFGGFFANREGVLLPAETNFIQ